MFDVVGLGCCCLDFLGVIPRLPELDEEIQLLQTSQQGGGEVATALVALAKLGSSVTFIGKVGDDPIGNFITEDFNRNGVDSKHLAVEPGTTSLTAVVLVDKQSGKRTILAGTKTTSDVDPDQVPVELIQQAKFLHLDGSSRAAALQAAAVARKTGTPVVLDADVLAYDAHIHQLIEQTDIVIASQAFTEQFTKTQDVNRAMDTLLGYGPSTVVITLGDQGSLTESTGNRFHTTAFDVDVVDTTGAGDVFHGAFIHGMLQSWELAKVLEFASAVAAIKCTQLGGRQGIPSFQQTLDFLSQQKTQFFG